METKLSPDDIKDTIYTDIDVFLDWKNRIKVLFGWRLTINVHTHCEHLPGRVESTSSVRVWREKKCNLELSNLYHPENRVGIGYFDEESYP